MTSYLVLIRGVNVGGKNTVPMGELRRMLGDLGFDGVSTYIASGNALLRSAKPGGTVASEIERALPERFSLDGDAAKVLVLSSDQLRRVVAEKPAGFGEQPEKYHSDAIFLMDITPADAMAVFSPREGVDRVWPGTQVIYFQRLSADRTRSRLNRIMLSPLYQSMTIRSWSTTTRLMALLDDAT
ncbi:DUF1697 domain-containing protein [Lysobacter korlensis]|uniref:DUF1697 domain-containing protein n=1 Tax=Lysobacter korlensis TaxID=553636 RepID=A0ABV6S1R9_9GAMM